MNSSTEYFKRCLLSRVRMDFAPGEGVIKYCTTFELTLFVNFQVNDDGFKDDGWNIFGYTIVKCGCEDCCVSSKNKSKNTGFHIFNLFYN